MISDRDATSGMINAALGTDPILFRRGHCRVSSSSVTGALLVGVPLGLLSERTFNSPILCATFVIKCNCLFSNAVHLLSRTSVDRLKPAQGLLLS